VRKIEKANKKILYKLLVSTLVIISPFAFSGDLEVDGRFVSTLYHYNSKFGNAPSNENQALALVPSVKGIFTSHYLDSSVLIKHTAVIQTDNTEDADKNYNDISYKNQLTLVDNVLFINVDGGQSYRTVDLNQSFVGDKILNPGRLTKLQQNTAGINFRTPNPQYFGMSLQAVTSKSKSDSSAEDEEDGLNNENLIYSGRLFQGEEFQRISWDVRYTYNKTSRTNFLDFEATSINANINALLYKEIGVTLTGSSEENDIDTSSGGNLRTTIDTTSQGAGIYWRSSPQRIISITSNTLEEGENTTDYIGLNVDWAFSPRTDLRFVYGKRFFGDTYTVDFNYDVKRFRSNFRYSEVVSTFANASASSGGNGVFVCTIGASDLSECFQPINLDYQLQAGEEYRDAFELSPDISEEVFLSKTGGFSLGYVARKFTASADLTYSDLDYLESIRKRRNLSLRLGLNYRLGRKIDLDFGTTFAKNKLADVGTEDRQDDIITVNASISKTLSKSLSISAKATYLNRDSNFSINKRLDRRITFSVDYKL
jgi:uncharacterized protein (PEP-CTERM system associated)